MKNSTSNIDLMYLTNMGNSNKTQNDFIMVDKKEVEFYKKRIFQLCKDLLRGKEINSNINNTFDEFCSNTIEHFKMIDKTEIMQNEYKNLNLKSANSTSNKSTTKILEENPDELMFKKIEKNNKNTMDKFVIKNVVKKQDEMVIPIQKKYNLKDVKYQEKDVEVKSKSSAVAMNNKKKKNKKKLNPKLKKNKNTINLNIN
jgi:hypothetical protein